MLSSIAAFVFSTLTTLLLVVDAPAAVPLFLSMTGSDSDEHRRRTASRAAVAAGIVLASFGALGGVIFRVLGAGHQHHHGRRRAGTGQHRDRQREDRDVGTIEPLGLLLR